MAGAGAMPVLKPVQSNDGGQRRCQTAPSKHTPFCFYTLGNCGGGRFEQYKLALFNGSMAAPADGAMGPASGVFHAVSPLSLRWMC